MTTAQGHDTVYMMKNILLRRAPVKWNVLYYNINRRQIESYNIFSHSDFCWEFSKIVKKHEDKVLFAEELWHCLMYYFWSKCEYELLVYPWPCSIERDKPCKIDSFGQITHNWSAFVDYVWEHRNELYSGDIGEAS